MFPNVRLMILATFASIVALSCGFAVFAAFRVNREPLVRLPAGAPLQFVAEYSAPASMTLGTGAASGSHFESSAAQIAAVAASLSELERDRRDHAEPATAVPTLDAAPEQSAAPDSQPATEPAAETSVQPASPSQSAPVAAASTDAPTQPSPDADAATPQLKSQAPDAAQSAKVDGLADTTGALPVATAPNAAVSDRLPDQVQPTEPVTSEPEIVPATATPSGDVAHKIVARRGIARPRRLAGWRGPTTQFTDQNFSFPQPNYQFAIQSAPQAAPPAVRRQVLVVTERRATKRAVPHGAPAGNIAVGGPFVSPPTH
jgi:hypothetical protein